jgi:hypothetical protein
MRKFGFLAVLLAATLYAGCDEDVTGGDGTGRLRINLTDAPGDLAEAWVEIEEIVLFRTPMDEADPEDGERIVIDPDVTGFINLLDLTNGQVMEIADQGNLPEGTYSELRLVIGDAYVVLNDGRVFATSGADLPAGVDADGTLRCPSCAQSGFKVKFQDDEDGLVVNGDTWVTIDFDAGRSFGHQAGNSGQWIMRPVLHATATNHEFSSISGNVALAAGVTLPQCGGQANTVAVFKPLAVLGTDTLSALVDASGNFEFGMLLPGLYVMTHVADVTYTNGDSLTIAATPSVGTIDLAEGQVGTANYQITAATCH